jgi:hypothetical protein
MLKQKRKKAVQRRKNFLPTLIAIFTSWIGLAGIVFFVSPQAPLAVLLFFLIFFITLLLTLSAVFVNTRRGFISSLSILIFLILRFFGIGNLLNLLLITAVAVTIETYFSRGWH